MPATGQWTMALIAAMAVAALMMGGVEAQSSPPGSSGCTNSLASLYPCLGFVTGNGSFARPSQGCCSGLATVVKTSAACLCQLISSSSNPLGIPINRTMALSLPGACNITTPPLSQCKASGAPADAPASSAGSSPAAPPEHAVSPSAESPTLSLAPSTNIPPASSDKENIPSTSPPASSGVAGAFRPSMLMSSAWAGIMLAIISVRCSIII